MDGPRACHESEFDEVISLINSVFRPDSDQDIRSDYPLIFHPSRMDLMRILKVDGRVVAHVPVAPREVVALGDRVKIGIISPTVTHPDHRRRGYATLCLRDCARIMEERGWPVSVLWTAEATFPFYRNSGWEAVGVQGRVYRLTPQDSKLFRPGEFDIASYEAGRHLGAIAAVHDAEPYRIARSRSDYEALFTLPKARTLVAMAAGELAAYAMVSESSNKPGLIESGGDPRGIEALVHFVLRERGPDRNLQVPVPLTPTALGALLEERMPGTSRPVEEADGVGRQMMRVNSLRALLEQTGGYLASRSAGIDADLSVSCRETGETFTLGLHDGQVELSSRPAADRIELTQRELSRLVFGAHPGVGPVELTGLAAEVLPRLFPFYFPVWELDHS